MEKFDLTYPRGLLDRSRAAIVAAFHAFNASRYSLALVYLAILVLAEILTAFVQPRAGLVLYGLIFILLLVHGSLTERVDLRKFLLSLALVPLIRLLSLSLPLRQFPLIYWYLVIGIPLLVATILTARQLKFRFNWSAGLDRRGLLIQLGIGVLGIVLGLFGYLVLQPDPLVAEFRLALLWQPVLILLIFTGFLEEVIFRGLMQHTSQRIMGIWGILYVAVLFAALHLVYRSFYEVVFIFGVALIFGIVVLRTGSIIGVSLSHGLMNVFLFLVFPFLLAAPLSQLAIPQTILAPAPPSLVLQSGPLIPDTGSGGAGSLLEPTPSPDQTTAICSLPPGWILYNVQPGDTWIDLSQTFAVSVDQLISENCLLNTDALVGGQWIFVPQAPTPTLIPTNTLSPLGQPLWTPTVTPKPTRIKPPVEPSIVSPTQTQAPASPSLAPTQGISTDTPLPMPTTAPTFGIPNPTVAP